MCLSFFKNMNSALLFVVYHVLFVVYHYYLLYTSSQTNLSHMNTKRSNTADYSEEQAILNDICVTLNQTITLINDDDGLQSPFIQDTIHCLVRKKRVHKYTRFGDGLHPDTDTVKLWAKVFAKGIHKNLSNLKLI